MKSLLVFILFVSLISINQSARSLNKFQINAELDIHWKSFKSLFNKKYNGLSEMSRRLIWEQNIKYIQQHNLQYDLGQHTYYLGVNEFADMTNEEFRAKYLSLSRPKYNATTRFLPPLNLGKLPTTVDWRTKGYVTPVKNQAQCGSCWAFSTTGSLEGQHFRETGKLISLSEQQLVDCSGDYDNDGCNGGLMDNGFKYIEKFGIESEDSYKYTAQNDKCKYNKSEVVTKVKGFTDIKPKSEADLIKATATVGPISVAIDASSSSFQFYRGGIYNEPDCSEDSLDHGVLIVGYGINNENKKYWIVKNSWGKSWGMEGYIMMSKDKNNQCGIASMASYPIV